MSWVKGGEGDGSHALRSLCDSEDMCVPGVSCRGVYMGRHEYVCVCIGSRGGIMVWEAVVARWTLP